MPSTLVYSESFDSSIGSFSSGSNISWVNGQGLRVLVGNQNAGRSNHVGSVFTPETNIVEWKFTVNANKDFDYTGTSHHGVAFNWNNETLSTSTTDRTQKPYLYHNVVGLDGNAAGAHSDVFWISQAYPITSVTLASDPVYIVGRGNTTLWVSSEHVNTQKRYFNFRINRDLNNYQIYLSTVPQPTPSTYTASGHLSVLNGPNIPVNRFTTGMVLGGWYNSIADTRAMFLDDISIYDGGVPIPLDSAKVWNGDSWVPGKQWDGASWVDLEGLAYRWNGSSWAPV